MVCKDTMKVKQWNVEYAELNQISLPAFYAQKTSFGRLAIQMRTSFLAASANGLSPIQS